MELLRKTCCGAGVLEFSLKRSIVDFLLLQRADKASLRERYVFVKESEAKSNALPDVQGVVKIDLIPP